MNEPSEIQTTNGGETGEEVTQDFFSMMEQPPESKQTVLFETPDGDLSPEVTPQKTSPETLQQKEIPQQQKEAPPSEEGPPKKQGRDYSGLTPEEVSIFKAMSNEAYAKLRPIYDEYKKGFKQQESRWYEVEDAYTLSPDYKRLNENLQALNFEENYWQQQLSAAEAGKPVEMLVGINENGEYIIGEPQEPTPEIKAKLINYLTKAQLLKTRVSDELDSIKTSYKQNWDYFNNQLKSVDNQVFSKLDLNNPSVKAAYDKWITKFPPEVRNNLTFQMLAKGMVVIEGLLSKLAAMEAKTNLSKDIKATATPSAGSISKPASRVDEQKLDEIFSKLAGHKLSV